MFDLLKLMLFRLPLRTQSLEEVELLQQMLTTGKIPDSNWNNPAGKKANATTEAQNENADVEMNED